MAVSNQFSPPRPTFQDLDEWQARRLLTILLQGDVGTKVLTPEGVEISFLPDEEFLAAVPPKNARLRPF